MSHQDASASPAKQHRPETKQGGTGKSTGKLVGHDKFVRSNPRSDRFNMTDFDHLEIYCADATNTARRFSQAFGMQMVASSCIDNGNFKYTSYVLRSNDVRFVFTAPYWTESPPAKVAFHDPFPDYSREDALNFIAKHGCAVKAVSIRVEDATKAFEMCVANGGVAVTRPTKLSDENGEIVYSEVVYYNDVKFRWIQGRETYKGSFMPGYKEESRAPYTYGLTRIDHVVSNVPCLTDVTEHLQKMLGLHEFSEFTAEDVGTVDSGLNSMVMANNDETVLFPVNEPTFGTRRKSQIQTFLEHNCGAGVQHIAIMTHDIIATMKQMTSHSVSGGVEFMPNPGEAYYRDHVPAKMGTMVSAELIKDCQKLGILIDRDEEGGLLQIFTKPLFDRPTLFVEIIQRLGCPTKDGRQKPACGGFGKGNFGALFKSIEDFEKIRDGELDAVPMM